MLETQYAAILMDLEGQFMVVVLVGIFSRDSIDSDCLGDLMAPHLRHSSTAQQSADFDTTDGSSRVVLAPCVTRRMQVVLEVSWTGRFDWC